LNQRAIAVTAVVLAAGEGTRMKSGLPKVLHRAAGRPLLAHVLAALKPLPINRTIVVASGPDSATEDAVRDGEFGDGLSYVVQEKPRGTGDAVGLALDALDSGGTILVLPGDAPLLETATLDALLHVHFDNDAAATILTARMSDPTGYGRVIRTSTDEVERIVEDRDATYEERTVDEINASVYVFDVARLADVLGKIDRENAQREYYLTDAIGLLHSKGDKVVAYRTHPQEVLGVNSRSQLARVSEMLRRRASERWMDEGVTIVDPTTTYIDASVQIGMDATIHPFTFLEGNTVIGDRADVGPNVRIINSQVGEAAAVSFAVVRDSIVGPEATVGPFASLRPGTRLDRGAKVGTFVETKSTTIGEGSSAPHLSYLGDAKIGRGVNVGAGTITCNWDGMDKHETVIEDDAYVGSDTMFVAPAHMGKRAATGAGAVVRGEIPDDALAVGMPARIIQGKGDKMARGTDQKDDGQDAVEPRQ